MAKIQEISVYFLTNASFTLSHTPVRHIKLENSECDSFQTMDAIELESCKRV